MKAQPDSKFTLADVVIEPQLNLIHHGGESVKVERQVMLLLLYMVKHAGCVVTREDILSELWSDSFSNDEALTQAVSKLRKSLRDSPRKGEAIQTIRKVGYRLTAPVSVAQELPEIQNSDAQQSFFKRKPSFTQKWSWVAIALIGALTIINGLTLLSNESNAEPRMVRVRTVIPGIDTSDVELRSLENLGLDLANAVRIVDVPTSNLELSDLEQLVDLIKKMD